MTRGIWLSLAISQPEMFRDERYSEKVDVYSYGVCVFELATRTFPFEGRTPLQIITAVCDGVRPVRNRPLIARM